MAKPTKVQFEMQGEAEAPETGVVVAVECSAKPLTLAALQEAFPYEGRYHFRQRMATGHAGGGGGEEYVWVDLTHSREEIRLPANASSGDAASSFTRSGDGQRES